MKAVDGIFLFRLMAREIALDHGIILTFAPKPLPDRDSSGMHINFSFTDAEGRNALTNGDHTGPENLNALRAPAWRG